MDRYVVEQKLASLQRCVQRITVKCPADAAMLEADVDLQDIISLNLSRAVQLCVDIGVHVLSQGAGPTPGTMGQTFDVLVQQDFLRQDLADRLKKSVGFRNIAVHSYDSINWQIVHSIARHHVSDFADFAKAMAARLPKS